MGEWEREKREQGVGREGRTGEGEVATGRWMGGRFSGWVGGLGLLSALL